MATQTPEPKTWNQHAADVLAIMFVFFVLLFAMQGVILDFVKWITPIITPDWDELSRRDQRVALKEGIFGGTFQWLKVYVFSKTGLQLGVPLLLSFMVIVLAEAGRGRMRQLNVFLAVAAHVTLHPDHVLGRNAVGDGGTEFDAGVRGFHD